MKTFVLSLLCYKVLEHPERAVLPCREAIGCICSDTSSRGSFSLLNLWWAYLCICMVQVEVLEPLVRLGASSLLIYKLPRDCGHSGTTLSNVPLTEGEALLRFYNFTFFSYSLNELCLNLKLVAVGLTFINHAIWFCIFRHISLLINMLHFSSSSACCIRYVHPFGLGHGVRGIARGFLVWQLVGQLSNYLIVLLHSHYSFYDLFWFVLCRISIWLLRSSLRLSLNLFARQHIVYFHQ